MVFEAYATRCKVSRLKPANTLLNLPRFYAFYVVRGYVVLEVCVQVICV